jgi:uncharacterized protein YifE (UPF0438 family)
VEPTGDDRITAFMAWRRRRALEAGLFRPDQLLDEWVFRRILLHAPRDIYELEKLQLLTGPLFHQYGDDLLALSQKRPTEDELPRRTRRETEPEPREFRQRHPSEKSRRPASPANRGSVRADDPPIALPSVREDKKSISDFEPAASHLDWRDRPFDFGCSTLSFKFWETEFLSSWGCLLESVAAGSVAPVGPDEEAVAALSARRRKAAKEWEHAWVKLVLRRAYESQ